MAGGKALERSARSSRIRKTPYARPATPATPSGAVRGGSGVRHAAVKATRIPTSGLGYGARAGGRSGMFGSIFGLLASTTAGLLFGHQLAGVDDPFQVPWRSEENESRELRRELIREKAKAKRAQAMIDATLKCIDTPEDDDDNDSSQGTQADRGAAEEASPQLPRLGGAKDESEEPPTTPVPRGPSDGDVSSLVVGKTIATSTVKTLEEGGATTVITSEEMATASGPASSLTPVSKSKLESIFGSVSRRSPSVPSESSPLQLTPKTSSIKVERRHKWFWETSNQDSNGAQPSSSSAGTDKGREAQPFPGLKPSPLIIQEGDEGGEKEEGSHTAAKRKRGEADAAGSGPVESFADNVPNGRASDSSSSTEIMPAGDDVDVLPLDIQTPPHDVEEYKASVALPAKRHTEGNTRLPPAHPSLRVPHVPSTFVDIVNNATTAEGKRRRVPTHSATKFAITPIMSDMMADSVQTPVRSGFRPATAADNDGSASGMDLPYHGQPPSAVAQRLLNHAMFTPSSERHRRRQTSSLAGVSTLNARSGSSLMASAIRRRNRRASTAYYGTGYGVKSAPYRQPLASHTFSPLRPSVSDGGISGRDSQSESHDDNSPQNVTARKILDIINELPPITSQSAGSGEASAFPNPYELSSPYSVRIKPKATPQRKRLLMFKPHVSSKLAERPSADTAGNTVLSMLKKSAPKDLKFEQSPLDKVPDPITLSSELPLKSATVSGATSASLFGTKRRETTPAHVILLAASNKQKRQQEAQAGSTIGRNLSVNEERAQPFAASRQDSALEVADQKAKKEEQQQQQQQYAASSSNEVPPWTLPKMPTKPSIIKKTESDRRKSSDKRVTFSDSQETITFYYTSREDIDLSSAAPAASKELESDKEEPQTRPDTLSAEAPVSNATVSSFELARSVFESGQAGKKPTWLFGGAAKSQYIPVSTATGNDVASADSVRRDKASEPKVTTKPLFGLSASSTPPADAPVAATISKASSTTTTISLPQSSFSVTAASVGSPDKIRRDVLAIPTQDLPEFIFKIGSTGKESRMSEYSSVIKEVLAQASSDMPRFTFTVKKQEQSNKVSPTPVFGQMQKKADTDAGNEWTCDTCLVPNKASASKCMCCGESKPGEAGAGTSAMGSTSVLTSGFTPSFFGAGMTAPTSTNSAKTDVAATGGGNGNSTTPSIFAPSKPGQWTCDVCLVKNDSEKTQCAACEAPNPSAKPGAGSGESTSPEQQQTQGSALFFGGVGPATGGGFKPSFLFGSGNDSASSSTCLLGDSSSGGGGEGFKPSIWSNDNANSKDKQ